MIRALIFFSVYSENCNEDEKFMFLLTYMEKKKSKTKNTGKLTKKFTITYLMVFNDRENDF